VKNFHNLKSNSSRSELVKKLMVESLYKNNGILSIIEIFNLNITLINNDYFLFLLDFQEDLLYSIKNIILSGIDEKMDRFSGCSGLNVLINQLEWPTDILNELKDKSWDEL
jgi:hypothetical protein